MPWNCFVVVETGMSAAWLRRFKWGSRNVNDSDNRCPEMPGDYSYHTVRVPIEPVPTIKTAEGFYAETRVADYKSDIRWPTHCACGYEFKDDDNWQVFTHALLRRVDGVPGEWPMNELPAGALLESPWLGEGWVGPDGKKLTAMCPPGGAMSHLWHMDGPSSGGGRWTRQGGIDDISSLSVSPSILTPTYHGFLTNGQFTDSLNDKSLPPGPDS